MPPPVITVLVIESRPVMLLGIKAAFADAVDVRLIAESSSASEGLEKFKTLSPDVTIIALRFPDTCTIDDLGRHFDHRPKARIIVLADHAGDAEIGRALKHGAAGYITNDVSAEDLLDAVRTVSSGRNFISQPIAQVLSNSCGQEELTADEMNVLRLIVGEMSNKEIAFALDVSENTVKTHIKDLFGKLAVSDRTSAATLAIKRGLVRADL